MEWITGAKRLRNLIGNCYPEILEGMQMGGETSNPQNFGLLIRHVTFCNVAIVLFSTE